MRAALLSLAFLLLHTSAMVIAFDGLDKRRRPQWLAVPAAHLGAALLVRHQNVTVLHMPGCSPASGGDQSTGECRQLHATRGIAAGTRRVVAAGSL